MEFPNIGVINIDVLSVTHYIVEKRRGKYVFVTVDFNVGERNFLFEMKVGKNGIWSEIGFSHSKYSYRNECPYCGRTYDYCRKFKRNQRKLIRTLLSHKDVLKELKKVRIKVLANEGFNILSKNS